MAKLLVIVGFAVGFLLMAASVAAEDVYACVNRTTGALRIVTPTTVCDSRKEMPLKWSASSGAEVVDADGKHVGVLLSLNFAARDIFGLAVGFAVFENGFEGRIGPSSIPSYYTSVDCSGQGYSGFDDDPNLPRMAMTAQSPADPGGYVDVGIWFGGGPLVLRAHRSVRYYDSSPPTPRWTPCDATETTHPSAPMNVKHETFRPPFRVISGQ